MKEMHNNNNDISLIKNKASFQIIASKDITTEKIQQFLKTSAI